MVDEQTYATHRYRPTGWLIALWLSFIGEVLLLWALVTGPLTVTSVGQALLGAALVLSILFIRRSALRLQDRIIRAEMEARLTRLGRRDAVARLSLPQLIALRFASDAELAALIDRAVSEQLSPDQIKRAVASWQADLLRT
jgi:hypothetical protein